MAAFMAAALVAPATLLVVKTPLDTVRPLQSPDFGFWDRHLSVYVGGGVGGVTERVNGADRDYYGWAHVTTVEYSRNGIYADVRIEDSYVRPHRQFQTARIGFLMHAKRKTAWGVTLAYRRVPGQSAQNGIEVGLPLVIGGLSGDRTFEFAGRFEPVYGFSAAGVGWSYRARTDWHLRGARLFPSFGFEQKAVRDGPDLSLFILQVGMRL